SPAAIDTTRPSIGIFAATFPACGSDFGFGLAHTRTRRFFPWTFLMTTLQCAAGTGAAPTVPTNARTAADGTRTRTAQGSHLQRPFPNPNAVTTAKHRFGASRLTRRGLCGADPSAHARPQRTDPHARRLLP